MRSILKAFSGKFSPSLYRKAGGTELRLFCKALSLPLWHCGESAEDGTGSQTAHGGRDPSRKQAGCEQVSSWQGQMGKETSEQSCGERQTLTPLSSAKTCNDEFVMNWNGGALSNHDFCSSDTWFQCDRAGTNARHCREKWSDSQPARLSGHFQCHSYYFWRSRIPHSQQDIHITEAVNVIMSPAVSWTCSQLSLWCKRAVGSVYNSKMDRTAMWEAGCSRSLSQ